MIKSAHLPEKVAHRWYQVVKQLAVSDTQNALYEYIHVNIFQIYTACVYIYIYINIQSTPLYIFYIKTKTFILDGINRSIALEKTPNYNIIKDE